MGLVLSNAQVIYTDPENSDCDDDDLLDGQEISIDGGKSKTVKVGSADGGYITYSTVVFKYSSDPWDEDTDDDGLTDKLEKEKKSNPLNPDSDNDCIPDGIDEDPMCYTTGKNYFFVYDNEGSDFISQADCMSKYAYDDENVEFIYVTKIDEFIEEWNCICRPQNRSCTDSQPNAAAIEPHPCRCLPTGSARFILIQNEPADIISDRLTIAIYHSYFRIILMICS